MQARAGAPHHPPPGVPVHGGLHSVRGPRGTFIPCTKECQPGGRLALGPKTSRRMLTYISLPFPLQLCRVVVHPSVRPFSVSACSSLGSQGPAGAYASGRGARVNGQFRAIHSANKHALRLWEETGEEGENPRMQYPSALFLMP